MDHLPVYLQLVDAIDEENWAELRALLSQETHDEENGRVAVFTDDEVHRLLLEAADNGQVEACRAICENLSPTLKGRYAAVETDSWRSPLHLSVWFGHLSVLRLFKEFNFNINQLNRLGNTPLYYAARADANSLEISRFLLENGADPNRDGRYGPLWHAVDFHNTEVVRLLLENGADPNCERIPANEVDYYNWCHYPRITDIAIRNGNAEILSMLLQHGAFVGHYKYFNGTTSLNELLRNQEKNRETKLDISRMLVEHAIVDSNTAPYLQLSLDNATNEVSTDSCEILLASGILLSSRALYRAVQAGKEPLCRLLGHYGADPFVQDEEENTEELAASPFHAAARRKDTSILRFFLEIWDARFASSGGRNGNGKYPVQVICCDKHVSLQAIKIVLQCKADALAVAMGEQGHFPFLSAAMSDTSLDVIYCLLNHCPDALRQLLPVIDTNSQSRNHRSDNSDHSVPASNTSGVGKKETRSRLEDSGPLKKKSKKV